MGRVRPFFVSIGVHVLLLIAGFGVQYWSFSRVKYARIVEVSLESIQAAETKASAEDAPSDLGPKNKRETKRRKPTSTARTPGRNVGGLPVAADELEVTEMPKLLSEVRIPYPPEARAQGIEGTVKVDLLVDENGVVRQSLVVEGPGHGLNEAALQAILAFKFSPAKIHDKPVAVRVRYSYRFVLDR